MPNDETEQERLDLYHHIFLSLLSGKLHTAPLDNPQKVLDVGTGTGLWAIDFAEWGFLLTFTSDCLFWIFVWRGSLSIKSRRTNCFYTCSEYPAAEVIGTDISPIQPSWWVLCQFSSDPPIRWDYTRLVILISYEIGSRQMSDLKLKIWKKHGHMQIIPLTIYTCDPCVDPFKIGIKFLGSHMSSIKPPVPQPQWELYPKHIEYWMIQLTCHVPWKYRKLRPGAYIEFQDYGCQIYLHDGTHLEGIHDKYPMATYFHYTVGAAEKQGRPLLIAPTMKARMEKAGFVDCVAQRAIWPVGPWPKDKRLKEIGKWALMGALDSLFPFGVHLLTREGWTVEQVKELCDTTAKSFYKTKYYTCG